MVARMVDSQFVPSLRRRAGDANVDSVSRERTQPFWLQHPVAMAALRAGLWLLCGRRLPADRCRRVAAAEKGNYFLIFSHGS